MLIGSNLVAEFEQEVTTQKDTIQTSDDEIITSYERIFAIFFRNLKRSSQKDKIREFIAIVHPNDFAKVLNRIHRLLNTYRNKKSNSQEVGKHISAAKEFASKCLKELEEAQKGVKSRDFSKNLNVWKPEIEDLLRIMHNAEHHITVLKKDCETKDLTFNAQTENARLLEYEDFSNNSTSYTRKDSGLFAVNLYQFFINNYGYPHWLWVAELLTCLFDTDETEASIRQNIKNQLQQSVVFLPHIGLYYLKKKDEKEAS